MKEIWKDVKNYEGYYQVSNFGRVKSLNRVISQICSKNKNKKQYNLYKEYIIKPFKINSGYLCVTLSKHAKSSNKLIHRLVAEAFIPNIDNCFIVNHKDENKLNNNITNLEWCTAKYNSNYGNSIKKNSDKLSKIIYQYDINYNLIATYKNSLEASKITKFSDRNIRKYCYLTKLYKNYYWSHERKS